MAGVKGRTGNPGIKNANKRSATSFTVSPGGEAKSNKIVGFKPSLSLESRIRDCLTLHNLTQTDFLEKAVNIYLDILEQKTSEDKSFK